MIKKIIRKINKFYQLLKDRGYYQVSYSQEGEDIILRKFFEQKLEAKTKGFYIDVGAHHPKRLSNTYYFYKLGWRGINIDAMPGSMKSFNKLRKNDINLESAVASVNTELTYYIFNEPAVNSFSKEISEDRHENSFYKVIDKIIIRTETLAEILNKNMPAEVTCIDFMSIDVEGLDLDVLKSNDWNKFRPQVIVIELLDFNSFDEDPIFIFLKSVGYAFQAKSYFTFFFLDTKIKKVTN